MSTADTRTRSRRRRRPHVSQLTMGLFLYVAGPKPTEATADESAVRCEGLHNQTYVCEVGHCCGNSQCCSYYYELWWFWLVWAIIFLLSCCCVCHHRRTKHRLQQQQRQHEINLIAYREAHNYNAMPFYMRFLPNSLLPDYEEVVNRPPTPPPPYSALHSAEAALPSVRVHSPGDQPSSLLLPPSSLNHHHINTNTTTTAHINTPANTTTIGSINTNINTSQVLDPLLLSTRSSPQDVIIIDPSYHQHKAPGLEEEEDGELEEKRGSRGSLVSSTKAGSDGGGDGDGDEDHRGIEEDLQKQPLLGEKVPQQSEEKEVGGGGGVGGGGDSRAGGRHRRSTGDSGIEVCVCGGQVGGGEVARGGDIQPSSSLEIHDDPTAELEQLLSGEEGMNGVSHVGGDENNSDRCNCGDAGGGGGGCAVVAIGDGHQDNDCEASNCRSVSHEEQQVDAERRGGGAAGSPHAPPSHLPPPVCLLLHTINEQEVSQCNGTTESHS